MKMLSSLFKNCIDFFVLKPPMVIFLCSLCFMVITTISLTLYIKYNNDIINTDRMETWISLAKQLDDVELCFKDYKTNLQENSKNVVETSSFKTSIRTTFINSAELRNKTKIYATYSLEDRQPRCPRTTSSDNNNVFLTVNFEVPANAVLGNGSQICAIITGPKQYMPQFSESVCDLGPQVEIAETNTVGYYTSSNKDDCLNNNHTRMKIQFNNNIDVNKFSILLSEEDKNVIIVHLTWCTYTLLVFIILMMLYAMLYQHSNDQQKTYCGNRG